MVSSTVVGSGPAARCGSRIAAPSAAGRFIASSSARPTNCSGSTPNIGRTAGLALRMRACASVVITASEIDRNASSDLTRCVRSASRSRSQRWLAPIRSEAIQPSTAGPGAHHNPATATSSALKEMTATAASGATTSSGRLDIPTISARPAANTIESSREGTGRSGTTTLPLASAAAAPARSSAAYRSIEEGGGDDRVAGHAAGRRPLRAFLPRQAADPLVARPSTPTRRSTPVSSAAGLLPLRSSAATPRTCP